MTLSKAAYETNNNNEVEIIILSNMLDLKGYNNYHLPNHSPSSLQYRPGPGPSLMSIGYKLESIRP